MDSSPFRLRWMIMIDRYCLPCKLLVSASFRLNDAGWTMELWILMYPADSFAHILGEILDHMCHDDQRILPAVQDQRRHVERIRDSGGLVHSVCLRIGGICAATAHGGQVIALAPRNLRIEHTQNGRLDILVFGDIHRDPV